MPSAFSTRFSGSGGPLDALYAQFGIASVYTDKTALSLPCSFRIQRHDPQQLAGTNTHTSGEVQTADGYVRESEVAKPIRDGRFSFDGEVWVIQKTPYLKNGQWCMTVSRVTADRRGEMRIAANA